MNGKSIDVYDTNKNLIRRYKVLIYFLSFFNTCLNKVFNVWLLYIYLCIFCACSFPILMNKNPKSQRALENAVDEALDGLSLNILFKHV